MCPCRICDLMVLLWCSRYGCSKWACEVLLKEMHEIYGNPVKIFRCGMILSHTR
jgi:fatty acid CoA ligase FadD9